MNFDFCECLVFNNTIYNPGLIKLKLFPVETDMQLLLALEKNIQNLFKENKYTGPRKNFNFQILKDTYDDDGEPVINKKFILSKFSINKLTHINIINYFVLFII